MDMIVATTPIERSVHAWLDRNAEAMPLLLEELVNIDSGSDDRDGIAAVARAIEAFLAGNGVATAAIEADSGPSLVHASSSGQPAGGALLLGHMDTVFPAGTAAKRPFSKCEGRYFGPGVADMKGGLVMNASLMAAFAACGSEAPPVSALFTVDEEVASPISRPHIEAVARRHDLVLNAEPGRSNGNIVIERRGGVFIRIDVDGVSAHSGVDFHAGASAIAELLAKARDVFAIAGLDEGITVNIGKIGGGTAINTVPDHACLLADIRFTRAAQLDEVLAAIEACAARTEIPLTRSRLKIMGRFNPMEANPQNALLARTYVAAARDLGHVVEAQMTGGCSDAGFTSSLGIPTLCGVGPVGGAAHTPEEYVVADTLLSRAKIAASTIIRAAAAKDSTPQTTR